MMKILYFGTVCDMAHYNSIMKGCKTKPSVASIVFESALLEGFCQNGAELEIHSFPMIPTFPNSKLLHFGGKSENLSCGYSCTWLNTVNLPIIKQITRRHSAKKVLKRWLKANADSGVVVTYSIPPFMAKDVVKYCKKYSVKSVAIVPDLLRDMYVNENAASPISKLKQLYIKPALKVQGEYSAYVYLTDAMHCVVAPEKPYMVMEGIASVGNNSQTEEKATVRAIMYAGMLHEKYGIVNLLNAYESLSAENTQLWLFGEGTAVDEIKRRAENNPSIKYFGSVPRDEILRYEKSASLLVNPRDANEEFTQYSFPSKTIEYMLSGTPLLTTKLKGIPQEYFEYAFTAENNSAEALAAAIDNVLFQSEAALKAFGGRARRFVCEQKNSKAQAARIIKFISEV